MGAEDVREEAEQVGRVDLRFGSQQSVRPEGYVHTARPAVGLHVRLVVAEDHRGPPHQRETVDGRDSGGGSSFASATHIVRIEHVLARPPANMAIP